MRSSEQVFVAVVSTSRHFGGHEEGGWWFDWSNVEKAWSFDNPRRARRFARRLEREEAHYAPRHDRFSVLGGTDVEVRRTRDPEALAEWQSRQRPRYE
jgi:hypothetical protein